MKTGHSGIKTNEGVFVSSQKHGLMHFTSSGAQIVRFLKKYTCRNVGGAFPAMLVGEGSRILQSSMRTNHLMF